MPGPEWTDPDLCRQPLPGLAPHPGGPLRGTPAGRLLLTVTSAGAVDFDLMWRQAEGGPAHPLVRTSQREWQGDWTLDGGRLAFVRDGDVWAANGDGSGPRRLTTDRAGPTDDEPRWSPDGTRVLLRSNRGRTLGLWTVNADGSGLSPLVRMEADSGSWSPDGRRIAFMGWQGSDPCQDAEIYVANADGSGMRRLTDDHDYEGAPAWSPDGRTLAFMRSAGSDASWDLYLIDVASGNQTRLTDAPGMDGDPVWSPDGRFIAFVSDRADPAGSRRGRRQRAFVMNLDGTGVSLLADLGPGGTEVDDWID